MSQHVLDDFSFRHETVRKVKCLQFGCNFEAKALSAEEAIEFAEDHINEWGNEEIHDSYRPYAYHEVEIVEAIRVTRDGE